MHDATSIPAHERFDSTFAADEASQGLRQHHTHADPNASSQERHDHPAPDGERDVPDGEHHGAVDLAHDVSPPLDPLGYLGEGESDRTREALVEFLSLIDLCIEDGSFGDSADGEHEPTGVPFPEPVCHYGPGVRPYFGSFDR